LGAGFVAMHREYYKGEGDGFPQVWVMVNFVSPCCQKCSDYPLTNLLFHLCRSMWIIDLLVFVLVLIPEV
jgi:hypothetical protein